MILECKLSIPFYCHSDPSCQCNVGYEGSGLQCTEIDPCSKPNYGGCHHEAICTKTGPGSNNCSCDDGFRGDGFVCVAIDPCMEQDAGNCHSNADCQYIGPGQVSIQCCILWIIYKCRAASIPRHPWTRIMCPVRGIVCLSELAGTFIWCLSTEVPHLQEMSATSN